MAKRLSVRVRGIRKRGRPQRALAPVAERPTPTTHEPASLPLSATEALTAPTSDAKGVPSTALAANDPSRHWRLPKNSTVKRTVVKILALRARGMTNADCATALGLTEHTVKSYLYRAGRNGWLENLDNPKDALDYDVMHKVVRNMHDALDSPDDERRDKMTTKIAEGTIFKQYDQGVSDQRPPMTTLAVQIVMPEGDRQQIRQGAIVGQPQQFIEGEVAVEG